MRVTFWLKANLGFGASDFLRSGRVWLVVAGVLSLNLSLQAQDELVTEGGEILRGEFVRQSDGIIHFRSLSFGLIQIPEEGVVLKRNIAISERTAALKNGPLTLNQPPPRVEGPKGDKGGAKDEEPGDKVREFLHLPDGMTVNAGLGIGFLAGETDGRNFSTSLDVNYDKGRYVGSFGGRYRYGQVEGFRVIDDYRFYGGVDRYFGDPEERKYFMMMKGFYSSDRVHLLDSQIDLFLGPGVDFKVGKRVDINLAVGYSTEWEDFTGNADEGIADASRVRRDKAFLFEKITVNLSDRFDLIQNGIYMTDLEEHTHFDIRFNNTLSYKLTSQLSLDLVYSLQHDDTSAEGVEDTISNLTIQLGYRL